MANKSIFLLDGLNCNKRTNTNTHTYTHTCFDKSAVWRSVRGDKKQPNFVFSLFYVAKPWYVTTEEFNSEQSTSFNVHSIYTHLTIIDSEHYFSLHLQLYIIHGAKIHWMPFGLIFIFAKLYTYKMFRQCQFVLHRHKNTQIHTHPKPRQQEEKEVCRKKELALILRTEVAIKIL